MAQMDHKEAVRLQAAEKYVLGEFPPNLRDEYEEHFFDCAECQCYPWSCAFPDRIFRRESAASCHRAYPRRWTKSAACAPSPKCRLLSSHPPGARRLQRTHLRTESLAPFHVSLFSYCVACISLLTFSYCSITRSMLPPRILRISSSL